MRPSGLFFFFFFFFFFLHFSFFKILDVLDLSFTFFPFFITCVSFFFSKEVLYIRCPLEPLQCCCTVGHITACYSRLDTDTLLIHRRLGLESDSEKTARIIHSAQRTFTRFAWFPILTFGQITRRMVGRDTKVFEFVQFIMRPEGRHHNTTTPQHNNTMPRMSE